MWICDICKPFALSNLDKAGIGSVFTPPPSPSIDLATGLPHSNCIEIKNINSNFHVFMRNLRVLYFPLLLYLLLFPSLFFFISSSLSSISSTFFFNTSS